MPSGEGIERFDKRTDHDRLRIRACIERMTARPRFAIVADDDAETKRSLEGQLYRDFSVVDAAAPIDAAAYVCVLQAGDRLAEHALYWIAAAIVAGGGVAMAVAGEGTDHAAGAPGQPR